jgi:nitroreductase
MIPNKIKRILSRFGLVGNRYLSFLYEYDKERFEEYSCLNKSNPETIATKIRVISHTIEKALSLPNCRADFGVDKIKSLITLYAEYSKLKSPKDLQCLDIVRSIVAVYSKHRLSNGLDVSFIPEKLRTAKQNSVSTGILNLSDSNIYGFEKIAHNRHSLRYYSDQDIINDDIVKTVQLAQTAPSACNRQSVRVYACVNKQKIDEILSIHGGLRGFGKPKVIFAITADITLYMNEYERNTMYVDGGIFVMNLLYSMSEYNMASCPIIWGAEPHNDKKLRAIMNIAENHQIVSLVVGGYYPDGIYRVARSDKRATADILKIVE